VKQNEGKVDPEEHGMEKRQTTHNYSIVTQVILLRLKAEITDHALAAFFKAVHQAQLHIPCLIAVATGENRSEAHWGFTHGIFLHFDHNPQEAKAHPKYQDLLASARSLCEQVVIFELPQTLTVPIPALPPESTPQPAGPVEAEPKQRGRPRKPQPAAPRTPERPSWRAWSADHIDERLKKIVIEQLGVEESEVVPSASLVEDLNADSLDLVEYIMSVEAVFKIEISDEVAEKLITVGETQAYLLDKGVL
jgi:acyl carrier protein